jgi:hypothetical protein
MKHNADPGCVETPEEGRARWRRDSQIPAVLAAIAAVGFLICASVSAGVVTALLTLVPWAVVASAAAGLVLSYSPAEFDSNRTLVLKSVAIGLSVHTARAIAFGITAPSLPSTGGAAGIGEALAMLPPLAISCVFVPIGLIALLVHLLFELSMTEKVFLIVLLFLADAASFGLLKIGGLAG